MGASSLKNSKRRIMTRAFLNIVTIGAVAMVTALAEAQAGLPSPSGQSSKHLSATGRMADPGVQASKLMGAQVNDRSGKRIAQIDDIILNPRSGHVDFALLSLTEMPTGPNHASGNLVPVPWVLLKTAPSAEYAGSTEEMTFTLNADEKKLANAPKFASADPNQSEWRQRIYAYYGVTPPPMGGAETEQGQIKGQGARSLQSNGLDAQPAAPTPAPPEQ